MRVLCDFHHEDLYHSLYLLLEKRLGHELYRPIGPEWFSEGYWMVYNHPATAQQYLGYHTATEPLNVLDESNVVLPPLNVGHSEVSSGLFKIQDRHRPNIQYRAISLDKFKNTSFDILISSIPDHINRFDKLISLYQPNAKHIFQAGNNWNLKSYPIKNLLNSTTLYPPHENVHVVNYHQEFDDQVLFTLEKCINPKSVVNLRHMMSRDKDSFHRVETSLPEWTWKAFGSLNRDGPIIGDTSSILKEFGFLWHDKHEGDGYGFNLHHAAACGRPIITHKSYFNGMTAAPLLISGVTCINLDTISETDLSNELQNYVSHYDESSVKIRENFKSLVNFDEESNRVNIFLNNLR